MKKVIYTFLTTALMLSMGFTMVPLASAHGGSGGDHSMPTPPPISSPTPPPAPTFEPTPCSTCMETPTPEPVYGGEEGHHNEGEHSGEMEHPAPMTSPLPTPQPPHTERHTVREEAQYHGVMSRTMTSTLGNMLSVIEEFTGLTVDEIVAARAEGASWSEIVTENGGDVTEVITTLIESKVAHLENLVSEGLLSESFVEEIIQMLTERWLTILQH